ncbi:MAG: ribosome-associated translation inhibitor RaiA [Deltaproteobacteria bacterium]|nr:ribosome-associated translation inhibitor RaiA [Deltaproteobacteria bacterium]
MRSAEGLLGTIRGRAEGLSHFFPRIVGCHVIVEAPHRHRQRGNHFSVRIDLKVPGREIVVTHNRPLNGAHKDAYVAVRDALDTATRRLQNYSAELKFPRRAVDKTLCVKSAAA